MKRGMQMMELGAQQCNGEKRVPVEPGFPIVQHMKAFKAGEFQQSRFCCNFAMVLHWKGGCKWSKWECNNGWRRDSATYESLKSFFCLWLVLILMKREFHQRRFWCNFAAVLHYRGLIMNDEELVQMTAMGGATNDGKSKDRATKVLPSAV